MNTRQMIRYVQRAGMYVADDRGAKWHKVNFYMTTERHTRYYVASVTYCSQQDTMHNVTLLDSWSKCKDLLSAYHCMCRMLVGAHFTFRDIESVEYALRFNVRQIPQVINMARNTAFDITEAHLLMQ